MVSNGSTKIKLWIGSAALLKLTVNDTSPFSKLLGFLENEIISPTWAPILANFPYEPVDSLG